jgi:hypothetical protein
VQDKSFVPLKALDEHDDISDDDPEVLAEHDVIAAQ